MSDENSGLIVTQQGVDVKVAADYQKTMDSRWTFLDILTEQEFEITHAESGATKFWAEKIYDHRLGYLPAFTYRLISLDIGTLNPQFFSPVIIATKDSIYVRNFYVSGDPTTPIKMKMFIRIFACDITTELIRPVDFIVPSASSPADIGVKILKNTSAGMSSHEISDYSINTQAKAIAIHQTGLRTAVSGTVTINHRLGYPPTIYMARTNVVADWTNTRANPVPEPTIQPMDVPTGAGITADTNNLFIKGGQSLLVGTFAFLITKEPQELAI